MDLVEYTSSGSLVTSFGSGGVVSSDLGSDFYSYPFAVTALSDGNILVGIGDQENPDFVLEEFNPDGSPDSSFGTDGVMSSLSLDDSFGAGCMTVLSSGNILVGGVDTLAEFNPDGSLDTSFGSSGFVVASGSFDWQSVTELSNGQILAVGISDSDEVVVAEYNSDGSLNTSFGSEGVKEISGDGPFLATTLTVLSAGDIQIGVLGNSDGDYNVQIADFDSDGELDDTFGTEGVYTVELSANDAAWTMTMTPSGQLFVAGFYASGSGGYFVAAFQWTP
jgi:uncharacterized delta-60 repeat protein